jgi:adenylyltransferase/sulfurtransferase
MSLVLLVGAGGLGCGAALGLGAGGARSLVIVDDDHVENDNLPRQVLLTDSDIGRPKAEALARAIESRFPDTRARGHVARLHADNAGALFDGASVLIDGTDNLPSKFLLNDAAVLAGKPLVHAAAVGVAGQLLTVMPGGRPCYRCLFEELPPAGARAAPSCAEAGVLGPVPGVLGALAASEALRIMRGQSPACAGRLIMYDSPSMTFRAINFRANPTCRVCGTHADITSLAASVHAGRE